MSPLAAGECSAEGCLSGIITFAELHETAFDDSHDKEWRARDVAQAEPTHLTVNEDLATAVRVFAACRLPHLPVVHDKKSLKLVGIAHEHAVMAAFHKALIQARAEERGEV